MSAAKQGVLAVLALNAALHKHDAKWCDDPAHKAWLLTQQESCEQAHAAVSELIEAMQARRVARMGSQWVAACERETAALARVKGGAK